MGAQLFELGEEIEDGRTEKDAWPFRLVGAAIRVVVDRPALVAAIVIAWLALRGLFGSGVIGKLVWGAILIVTVLSLIKVWGRQERWARRRKFTRRWVGRPGHPGLAYELGMVNRNGRGPRVTRYRDDGQAVEIEFENAFGVQLGNFEDAATVLADGLGGYATETEQVRPGFVSVRIVLEDTLMNARQTGMVPDWVGDDEHDQDHRAIKRDAASILADVERDDPWNITNENEEE